MECPNCGQNNKDKALYCNMCGQVMLPPVRTVEEQLHDAPGSPNYVPTDNDLKRCAAVSRRFLLTVMALLLVPFALTLLGWKAGQNPLEPDFAGPEANQRSLLFWGLTYASAIYGYVLAKTGQSYGAKFWPNFVLGAIPLTAPAAWANICGRPPLRPYVCLIADALILGGGYLLSRYYPFLMIVLIFCMLPFVIYHYFGCALGQIGHALGFPQGALALWLCMGPTVLLGILLFNVVTDPHMSFSGDPFAIGLTRLYYAISLDVILSYYVFKFLCAAWLLATFYLWIKSVYQNLKLPLV